MTQAFLFVLTFLTLCRKIWFNVISSDYNSLYNIMLLYLGSYGFICIPKVKKKVFVLDIINEAFIS